VALTNFFYNKECKSLTHALGKSYEESLNKDLFNGEKAMKALQWCTLNVFEGKS